MDPPNVSWFAGAFATGFGVSALLSAIPESHNGLWVFLAALGFVLAFEFCSVALLRAGWWVPGGLAATLAVVTFPGVAIGFLQLIDLWPDDQSLTGFDEFSGYAFGVALATALFGLGTYAITGFTFILAVVVGALMVAVQFLVAALIDTPTAEDRATAALIAGAVAVILGIFLDAFGRRREAFWLHVLGWLGVAVALAVFAADASGDTDRGWVPMLVAGLLLLVCAGPIGRATWAVFGVLGYYAGLVHYLAEWLDDNDWPFALVLLAAGVSLFAQGMLLHRYRKSWGSRFLRGPPPDLPP